MPDTADASSATTPLVARDPEFYQKETMARLLSEGTVDDLLWALEQKAVQESVSMSGWVAEALLGRLEHSQTPWDPKADKDLDELFFTNVSAENKKRMGSIFVMLEVPIGRMYERLAKHVASLSGQALIGVLKEATSPQAVKVVLKAPSWTPEQMSALVDSSQALSFLQENSTITSAHRAAIGEAAISAIGTRYSEDWLGMFSVLLEQGWRPTAAQQETLLNTVRAHPMVLLFSILCHRNYPLSSEDLRLILDEEEGFSSRIASHAPNLISQEGRTVEDALLVSEAVLASSEEADLPAGLTAILESSLVTEKIWYKLWRSVRWRCDAQGVTIYTTGYGYKRTSVSFKVAGDVLHAFIAKASDAQYRHVWSTFRRTSLNLDVLTYGSPTQWEALDANDLEELTGDANGAMRQAAIFALGVASGQKPAVAASKSVASGS